MNHVDSARRYMTQVLAGQIDAGKHVLQACQRQFDDLERKSFDYHFDVAAAHRVCEFIELLPHTKGQWAASKSRIKLQPWQQFILTTLFGWRDEKGLRRFREAYIEVPRKNGKSLLAASIGLYCFIAPEDYGAEVYSGATSEKQAWEVFRPAQLICQRTPSLMQHYGITVRAKALCIPSTGARFEPLIGHPGDGASPSCAIVDEYHEHSTPDLYHTMKTGMGARNNPLMLVITTAGVNIYGPCYDKRLEVVRLLEGVQANEQLFGIIYHIDEQDDWTDPNALVKANPNYGVSVSADFLKASQIEAIHNTAQQNIFLIKHLNRWVNAKATWLNLQDWLACGDDALQHNAPINTSCYMGLDLASKIDFTARVNVFVQLRQGVVHYLCFAHFYLPDEAVCCDATKRYQRWQLEQWLNVTPGAEIDYRHIEADIQNDFNQFEVKEVVYDPWHATQLIHELQDLGATCVEYRHTPKNMTAAMVELEAAIKARRFHHNNHPILNWMVSNAVKKDLPNDMMVVQKEKPEQKIDGVIACLLAMGRAMYAYRQQSSIYERVAL